MQRADYRLAAISLHLRQRAFQTFSGRAEVSERIIDADAPVGARDDLANYRVALIQSRLVQAESKFDHVRNISLYAFAQLIFEGVDIAASGQEPLLEMFGADDAEMLGSYRLSVFAHCREQLGDPLAVDLLDAKEVGERLVRAANLIEHLALNG